ncbi:PREDICTED: glycine receptor subunit alpha-4 isoform X6 [Drosophila arizonae]|uniref:Glycine receptor subunit alpha-4 isoform X6 n=1 Tax=Drosophila arizonae TaxID=7263 RepID=A0ABM1PE72_DROAR|nr:PREDICTED: glycine receptor subunit alpha-4 isoform X6 [Drosophila arizonae]
MLGKYNTKAFISLGLTFILMWISEATDAHVNYNYTTKPRVVLPPNYVKEMRPPSKKGSPVIVDFSIFVVDINSINVEDMDFRVDMFIHQRWMESRLEISDDIFEEGDDYVTLLPEFFDNLWQPDPYFLNSKIAGFGSPHISSTSLLRHKDEKESKNFHLDKALKIATLTHKFTSVTLYKNKTVRYAARMHAIIACQMEFQLYPMDIQVCPIYIESFSSNNQKVKLRWSDSGVTLNPELKLLQYNLGQPLELEESDGYMPEKVGNFSRLTVYFRFERQIGHHLIQTFAPSSLVVMLSWFSFWLGLDAIPGRVTLLVTCMLTLVTMFTGLRADIPPVARWICGWPGAWSLCLPPWLSSWSSKCWTCSISTSALAIWKRVNAQRWRAGRVAPYGHERPHKRRRRRARPRCRAMAVHRSRRVAKAFCPSPGRTRIRASRR